MSFICIVCRDLLSNNPQDSLEGASAVGLRPASADIVVTSCGHMYHLMCLEDWFNKQINPRQECPYCKTVVKTGGHQRIFPIGDEETDDINAKMKKAKEATKESEQLRGEINQFEILLRQTAEKLEEANLTLDILSFEYAQKVSELEECQSQKNDLENITEATKHSWTETVEELNRKKIGLEKKIELMEAQLIAYQNAEAEVEQRQQSKESCSRELEDHTTVFLDTVKRLTEKLDASLGHGSPSCIRGRTISMGSQTDSFSEANILIKPLDADICNE